MTFDGVAKIITLSTTTISAGDIWSDWVDWLATNTDNNKYLPALKQVGGDDLGAGLLIPPYIFLINGWRVRPMESNHLLVITGNLYVEGGGQPVINTIGAYNVSVQYTVPVQAQGYSTTSSGTSISAADVWSYSQRELTSASTSSLTLEEHNKLMALETLPVDANIVSVQGVPVVSVDDFKADVSGISVNVDPVDIWTYTDRTLTAAAGLTAIEHDKLMELDTSKLDVNVSTRATPLDITNNVDVATIVTAVWSSVTRTLTAPSGLTTEEHNHLMGLDTTNANVDLNSIAEAVWWFGGRTLSTVTGLTDAEKITLNEIATSTSNIKTKTDKLQFDVTNRVIAFLNDRSDFSLHPDERVALANEIERQIIDETDAEKVLQAIIDKIAQANPSLDDLTLGAIATAVWSTATRTLTTQAITLTTDEHNKLMSLDTTNLDTPISTRARPIDVVVNPTLEVDERAKLMSLDTSKLDVNVSTRARPIDVVINPTLTTIEHDKLMALDTSKLDVNVSTRATAADLTINPTLTTIEHDKLMSITNADYVAIATAVWFSDSRTLTYNPGLTPTQQIQISDIITSISAVQAKTDKLQFDVTNRVIAFLNDRSDFSLSLDERIAIANEVEKQIIDETDSEKVLTAITNKIAEMNPSLDDLTVGAIASAVWSNGTRTLSEPAVTLSTDEHNKLMSLDTSKLDVNVSTRARPIDVVINPTLQSDERNKLMSLDTSNLDATVSSRATSQDVQVAPSLQPDERAKLLSLTNTTIDNAAIAQQVWQYAGRTLTDELGLTPAQIQQLNEIQANANLIAQTTNRLVFDVSNRVLSYVNDKTGYQLSPAERVEIANEVERQIIDDSDSEKVLKAITDKIAQVNPSLDGLTVTAIASGVWASAIRTLTVESGLSAEEHSQLMALPTAQQIWDYVI